MTDSMGTVTQRTISNLRGVVGKVVEAFTVIWVFFSTQCNDIKHTEYYTVYSLNFKARHTLKLIYAPFIHSSSTHAFFFSSLHIGAVLPLWSSVWEWRMVSVMGRCGLVVADWDLSVCKKDFCFGTPFWSDCIHLFALEHTFSKLFLHLCYISTFNFSYSITPCTLSSLLGFSAEQTPSRPHWICFTANWLKQASHFGLYRSDWRVFGTESYPSDFRGRFLHQLT